ncbi:MAG: pilus assembly protein [Deltaproteobacteria bacterium]|nr:MAG: hypothetical protein DMD33_03380 [Gemmatimonadota bacterium]TMA70560.1 MAG: pilus assembly protein [Deltaproteobacteria bacterium]
MQRAVLPTHQAAAGHAGGARRGQALVEMGMVVVLLFTLALGILEFGRAWMILNVITHAAGDGARAASLDSNRDGSGKIVDATPIQNLVLGEIGTVMDTSTLTSPSVAQGAVGGIPVVTVTVNGSVPYLTGLFGTNFTVARAVTFRDEGK